MATTKNWHLITYDIRDPGRWRKVYRQLLGYGEHLQLSVFRVRLTPLALERLRWELERILAEEDDLLIIPLCGSCAEKIHARNRPDAWPEEEPPFRIIG